MPNITYKSCCYTSEIQSELSRENFISSHVKITCYEIRGLVSKETVVLRRWGSDTREFGISTELIM